MKYLTARPDLGATRAYVPLGIEIWRSVLATPLPLAGITQSCALQWEQYNFRTHTHWPWKENFLFQILNKPYKCLAFLLPNIVHFILLCCLIKDFARLCKRDNFIGSSSRSVLGGISMLLTSSKIMSSCTQLVLIAFCLGMKLAETISDNCLLVSCHPATWLRKAR